MKKKVPLLFFVREIPYYAILTYTNNKPLPDSYQVYFKNGPNLSEMTEDERLAYDIDLTRWIEIKANAAWKVKAHVGGY